MNLIAKRGARRFKVAVAASAIVAAGVGMGAGTASAFTPGTGCGTGSGSSSGISAVANFVSLPPCSGYIRVANKCAAFSGATQWQYGPIRTYPTSSNKTCSGNYIASLASWGWQISGTP